MLPQGQTKIKNQMKQILLTLCLLLALSSSCLLGQARNVTPAQIPANTPYSADPVHVGKKISPGLAYGIGTPDAPVTVTEYVAFLNEQHFTGQKMLTYLQSWNPSYYAIRGPFVAYSNFRFTQHSGHYLSVHSYDQAYDTILMPNERFMAHSQSCMFNVQNNDSCINWSYSWEIDPKNSEQIDYTFSYSVVEGRGDWIIDSVLSEDMANRFNDWRASQSTTSEPSDN